MRTPVGGAVGGMSTRISSTTVWLTAEVYETQPGTDASPAKGTLNVVTGSYLDDAAQVVQHRLTLSLASVPTWLRAGMWVKLTVGMLQGVRVDYLMGAFVIDTVTLPLDKFGGGGIEGSDPSVVLDGRPYESDTTLTGTLRTLVGDAAMLALSRVTDVSGVPATAVPANTTAEFGAGRWATCVTTADDLGVVLRFTDAGDVVGTARSATPPASSGVVERALLPGGTSHQARTPTSATVLVTRGSDTIGLVGTATAQSVTGSAPPSWYRPLVVTDRQEGDPATTQAMANQWAKDLITARLTEMDTYQSLPILPSPWLQAGVDVVTFGGIAYWVRAISLELATLATTVTLRRVVP